jgi:hypothetical protein
VLTMTSPISEDEKAAYAANRFLYSVNGADAFASLYIERRTSVGSAEAARIAGTAEARSAMSIIMRTAVV